MVNRLLVVWFRNLRYNIRAVFIAYTTTLSTASTSP